MTQADDYLAEVRRQMRGMDPTVGEDVLRELRSHIAEATAANGGDLSKALATLGSARDVGREYRKVYGYGLWFRMLFVGVAFLLAIPSSPVLQVTEEYPLPNALALPFLLVLVAWLLSVSLLAGSRVGLYAGATALGARVLVAVLLAVTPPYAMPTADGVLLFGTVAVVLLLLGWLPGTARKTWTRPGAEL